MEENNIKYFTRNFIRFMLPILSILTLITIIKFTRLHVVYFPQESPLINKEYFYLFASLVIFILSMYYKIKISTIVSLLCIALSLINIIGFTLAAVLYYKQLNLNQFV